MFLNIGGALIAVIEVEEVLLSTCELMGGHPGISETLEESVELFLLISSCHAKQIRINSPIFMTTGPLTHSGDARIPFLDFLNGNKLTTKASQGGKFS
jgi:hypothetical protein